MRPKQLSHQARRSGATLGLRTLLLIVLGTSIAAAPRPAPRLQMTRLPFSPQEAAQQRIKEFVEVFNSGDLARIRDYVTTTFAKRFLSEIPPEEHVKILSRGFQGSGGYSLGRLVPFGPNRAAGSIQTIKDKQWMRIMLTVEDSPPFKIASIGIMPSGPVLPEIPAGPATDAQVVELLKKYLDQASTAGQFSGTVLLAKDGKPLFKAAYGLADRSFDVANRIDTKFNLGSMNKMFTAVAIAQLAEKGKLSFEDPISKYLTGWLPDETARTIKIQHLLTHTSGLGSYFNDKFMKSSRDLYREVDDYKPLVAEEKPAFPPGSRWSYSNTGFLLLGAIVEKASGQNYFEYVRQNIYRPAGMTNSDCYDMDVPVPNLAIGYTHERGEWRTNTFAHVIRGGPAGGGFSTVEDLLRFDIALRGHKLLNPESTKLVLSAKPEMKSPQYGYGFQIDNRLHEAGHGGGFPGISSNLSMFLESGYTLAVLSNIDAGAVDVADIVRTLLGSRGQGALKEGVWDQAAPPPPAGKP